MSIYYATKEFVRSFSESVAEEVLKYIGLFTNAANIGARLMPRSVSRKFARIMNRK